MIKKFRFTFGFLCGVVTALLLVCSFLWYGLLEAPAPWKVIEASDSRFILSEFKLTDYRSTEDLKENLKIIIPKGTNKTDVDAILVNYAGAWVKKRHYKHPKYKDKNDYEYGYENIFRKIPMYILPLLHSPKDWPSHYIKIEYDDEDNVKDIKVLLALGLPILGFQKSDKQKEMDTILKGF